MKAFSTMRGFISRLFRLGQKPSAPPPRVEAVKENPRADNFSGDSGPPAPNVKVIPLKHRIRRGSKHCGRALGAFGKARYLGCSALHINQTTPRRESAAKRDRYLMSSKSFARLQRS